MATSSRPGRAAIPRFVSLLGVAGIVAACGASNKEVSRPAAVSSNCPDLTKADELAAFDFAKEFSISQGAAEKLKAAALAAAELEILAEKLDADLGIACAQIATDLGDKGDWRSGNDACAAASKAVRDARAKLGPDARAQLVVRQPVCLTDVSLVTKCASLCDSSAPAEKVRAECQQKAGRCDGNCDGNCEPRGPARCDGTCSGTCEGAIKGTCGGRCIGTCDGKRVAGACLGVCNGTCERGAVNGECKGACTGTCKLAKPAICAGICSGACSVELTDAKCAGDFKTPDVSADCRARCDLAVVNHTECSTPQVGIVVSGAKDRETTEAMKIAVDKSFPALVKILQEVGEKGPNRVSAAQAVVESARKTLPDMARAGGKATAASSEAGLAKCFDGPFSRAVGVAGTVSTGIARAAGIRDDVSK